MSLKIHGAHGSDVWADINADLVCLSIFDLRVMRNKARDNGTATYAGTTFDESDVTALIQALTGPHLDDCADCEGPALINIEGRIVCPGHAAGYTEAEEWSA